MQRARPRCLLKGQSAVVEVTPSRPLCVEDYADYRVSRAWHCLFVRAFSVCLMRPACAWRTMHRVRARCAVVLAIFLVRPAVCRGLCRLQGECTSGTGTCGLACTIDATVNPAQVRQDALLPARLPFLPF